MTLLPEDKKIILRKRLFAIKYNAKTQIEKEEDKARRIRCIEKFLRESVIDADAETLFQKLNSLSLPCG